MDSGSLERKQRARAAWAYSLLRQEQLVAAAGLNWDTAKNWLQPGGKTGPDLESLYAIVDAAGVPRDFADTGFTALEVALAERVAALEVAAKVLLPLLLERHEASGEQLPPDAVQALELVLGMKGQ